MWFSLEGSPQWVKTISGYLPLTRMLSAIRRVANDGAVLADVLPDIFFLAAFSVICLAIASWLFSWTE